MCIFIYIYLHLSYIDIFIYIGGSQGHGAVFAGEVLAGARFAAWDVGFVGFNRKTVGKHGIFMDVHQEKNMG